MVACAANGTRDGEQAATGESDLGVLDPCLKIAPDAT